MFALEILEIQKILCEYPSPAPIHPAYRELQYRGHPGAFREGEVSQQFQDFREKFWSKFWISLYIFTSPSAQDREKSASLGRIFLPNRPLG